MTSLALPYPILSICIPTCDRPSLLVEAVRSCLATPVRPLQILIGDDSADKKSEVALRALNCGLDVELRYRRHAIRLGQAQNLNWLLDEATAPWVLILHDDDRLCPDGIERLLSAAAENAGIRCVFGKQYLINDHGERQFEDTRVWNERYQRYAAHEGPQQSSIAAAFRQQLPNNAFLVETSLAREVRYRHESLVGHGVDADFGFRLAQAAGRKAFYFVNCFVSDYRISVTSISQSVTLNRREDLLFQAVQEMIVEPDDHQAKLSFLERTALPSVLDAAMAGKRRTALSILRSPYYRHSLFTRWSLYRLVCIISPGLGRWLRRLLIAVLPGLENRREKRHREHRETSRRP